jgi:NAD(P)-dependent dehydrogenase (short-subunit alcohol dehydrogenase family)
MTMTSGKVVVVAGVGPGNGAALARRFAVDNARVAMLGRSKERADALAAEIAGAKGYACDVGDEASVKAAFAAIRGELGEVDTLLFNAGSGAFADVETITAEQFEASWRVNALGAFLCSREVIPAMKAAGQGNIVFVGATASRRGSKMTAAFAPAKAAQRSLAESMARSLWPAGIHVAIIILDGIVDLENTRQTMPDKPVDFFLDPAGLAEIAWDLTRQSRRAWSFEVEARPFGETW